MNKLKRKVRVAIASSLRTGETFPHCLLHGVGGTGKTTLARAIGNELHYHFVETHAAAFKKRQQLYDSLVNALGSSDRPLLFFLDEIHRLKFPLQEALYPVMEEFWIPTLKGRQHIKSFALIGATTRFDMLDANSFVTRFGNIWEVERYSEKEICNIISFELDKLKLDYDLAVVRDIAKRCLGIPRIAVRLVNKVRDMVLSHGSSVVTMQHTTRTFELEEIDVLGLQAIHRRYLAILAGSQMLNNGYVPLGIGPLAGKMRAPEDLLQGSVEPILFELNLVSPTPRGRILTKLGAEYLEKCGKIT